MTDTSFGDRLRQHAERTPDRTAFTFLDAGTPTGQLDYAHLDERARGIAAALADSCVPGDRALLLFAPGLDYVAALFGCLYAGVAAVPVYPPTDARHVPRLRDILADCAPAAVLTVAAFAAPSRELLDPTGAYTWHAVDDIPADRAASWTRVAIGPALPALLQYTSGTTGTPKGVLVTHANLLANSDVIRDGFEHDANSHGVIWLPPYHDMGLVGGILQPVHVGFPVTLMSPLDMLRDPYTWLHAISTARATTSGGPNFAYDLCVRKIPPERRARLDLSSWRVAFTGAEPVSAATMSRFADAFAVSGFRPGAFYPCYGLAETTLMATGSRACAGAVTARFDADRLSVGQAVPVHAGGRTLVSSGRPAVGHELTIVDRQTGTQTPDGTVGEICLRGPSVSPGYWAGPDRAAVEPAGGVLRTQDLGVVVDGELYVVGRIKDVLIVRGRNHPPDLVEATVASAHPGVRAGCVAAFQAGTPDGTGGVQVACEVSDAIAGDAGAQAELTHAVRAAVVAEHGLAVERVWLLARGTLPKTSSGKIRRSTCSTELAAGTLEPITTDGVSSVSPARSHAAIPALIALAADVLGLRVADIAADRPLTDLGLDSVSAIEIAARAARDLRLHLPLERILSGASCADLAATAADLTTTEDAEDASDELTANERAMWMQSLVPAAARAYLLCHAVTVTGPVDPEALDAAVRDVAARHDALRTRFVVDDAVPHRRVDDVGADGPSVEFVDARDWEEARLDADLADFADARIDLGVAPVWRFRAYSRDAEHHVLAVATHHAVADLWSLTIVVREILDTLAGLGRTSAGAPGMPGVAAAELRYLAGPGAQRDIDTWQGRLRDLHPARLRSDHPRPSTVSHAAGRTSFAFDATTSALVAARAREWRTTPYAVLLGALAWALHRYTGEPDAVVGAPFPGRTDPSEQDVVGMLVNTLPVPCHVERNRTFQETVLATAESLRATTALQRLPFPELVEALGGHRDPSRHPVWDILFALQHAPGRSELAAFGLGAGRLTVRGPRSTLVAEPRPIDTATTPADLYLEAAETDGGITGIAHFRRDLWDADTIAQFVAHWQQLVTAGCTDPGSRVGDTPLAGDDSVADDSVADDAAAPAVRGLAARVAEHARISPEAPAVSDPGGTVSYGRLSDRASGLAARLAGAGVGREDRVAVLVRRSADYVAAAVGVARAGAAFVPLDPDAAVARLAAQVRDCSPSALVHDGTEPVAADLAAALGDAMPTTVELHGAAAPEPPEPPTEPDRTAYVMYTSGTSGEPKGVCVTHSGVANLIDDLQRRAPVGPNDRCAWWTNTAFDLSVYEIWSALDAGAHLVVVPENVRLDAAGFAAWLADEGIVSAYVPPFAVRTLAEQAESAAIAGNPPALRRVIVGVEPVGTDAAERIAAAVPGVRVVNAYGPTEATIIATLFDVGSAPVETPTLPIGHGLPHAPVYLLDAGFRPVPRGAVGEVFVGGCGVARGYLGRPAQTAARHLPDPYRRARRMYGTGDRAYRDRDGALHFLGRTDAQVKLRGVRVELGEVEAVLQRQAGVHAAAAAVHERGGQHVLIGYVAGGADLDVAALRDGVQGLLPGNLALADVLRLDRLPLTPNGKLDRAALPAPRERDASEPPQGPLETAIAGVWSALLDGCRIGRRDDFFALGGHSLLAAQAVLQLSELLGREIELHTLFANPTPAALAHAVNAAPAQLAPIPLLDRSEAPRENAGAAS